MTKRKEPSTVAVLAADLMRSYASHSATVAPFKSPYAVAADAGHICALGRKASRLAVQQCNGIVRNGRAEWTEADEARNEKARAKVASDAAAILSQYGVNPDSIKVHGDPRGHVLTFTLSNSASWGV